jgi:diguanylate cyclase (GGDEF)-like protein
LWREYRLLSLERDQALLLSGLDELTEIPNRRFTLARLDALLQEYRNGALKLCVALVDLDHFKSINDTFGHETGDIALRHFAQHCAAVLPKQALIGRMGGEEFLIAFADTTCEQLTSALQELLSSMPPVSSRLPAQVSINLSFSAGVAEASPGESRTDLLARADSALYAAKRLGRGRIEVHPHSVHRTS